jgi:nucleotide-binding universal stress UspA family protein
VADTAAVLGRLYDGIEFRGFAQDVVDEFAAYAGVPVERPDRPVAPDADAGRRPDHDRLPRLPVVIVNVVGTAGYVVPTAADQHDLDAVTAHLTSNGVRNSLRQITDDASPADIILGVAREVDASLIVLGLHQRSWIAKRVLGSTARSVVLAAPCAVLVVPDIDQHNREPRSADVDAPPLRSMGQTPPWTPRKPDDDGSRS